MKLRRETFGYSALESRYTITPLYGLSLRGGTCTRVSSWQLKDTQGEYPTRERPLLSDIRDILNERH